MAEIYQLPENGGNSGNFGGLPFSIPIGGNNGGLFGNGNNSIADLFAFAIIASMFGWNNGGGFGNNGGGNNAAFLSTQIANDSGRQLVMQAITSNGEANRAAVQNLATTLGQDFNTVNSAVQNVQTSLNQIANQQGLNAMQVINAIQSGNASLASQFQNCCCQNQLAIANQTNTLQNGINGIGQQIAAKGAADNLALCQQTNALTKGQSDSTAAILAKLSEMQTQTLQDKLDAARAENTRLAGEISQANQNNAIAGMIANAVNPIAGQLAGIRGEVDAIKRCQPPTITLPNNQYAVVPTLYANAAADFVASYWANRLSGATTGTTTGGTTTTAA